MCLSPYRHRLYIFSPNGSTLFIVFYRFFFFKHVTKYFKVKVKLSHVWLFATTWILQSKEFSRPEYWIGQPFPSLGDLPNPGIKPKPPALQVDSLPVEPQEKPKNAEVGNLSLLQWISPTQESNQCLPHCGWILYQLSYQGSPYQYIYHKMIISKNVIVFHITAPWFIEQMPCCWMLIVCAQIK